MSRTVLLVILDGWGIGRNDASNPIHVAGLTTLPSLEQDYPVASLQASGISVGLPWEETGNSEVGHLTIGAGKVVYQYYPKIMMAIRDGSFATNPALTGAFAHAKKNGGAVNLVGLLTHANTHAAIEHVKALIAMGEKEQVPVHLHLFGDAIDGAPFKMWDLLEQLPQDKIATLIGRYYAMDRGENWQLIEKAYRLMTAGEGAQVAAADIPTTLQAHYQKNLSEEYLPPLVIDAEKRIKDNDAVVFFNYREDGIRELADVFAAADFAGFARELPKNLYVATMTKYADHFTSPVAFPADNVDMPLGKVLADLGKNQLRVAESYKYAHITYFFNGHVEEPFKNEYRVVIPSQKTTHPDEHPELMAEAITDRVVGALNDKSFDFILVNYSNPDTIAHTGNYDACIAAAKIVDAQIARVAEAAAQTDAVLIITSDHGNFEEVLNPQTGKVETQHDDNPVPLYLIAREYKGRKFATYNNLRTQTTGVLADVAPTILELMEIPKPPEMNGRSLLRDLI